ncbi:MAG: GSCFA domain-containing protein [Massilibacteroides sp.]|nr:GSCFA domain-containing protein [Massilibacteroides sp.]
MPMQWMTPVEVEPAPFRFSPIDRVMVLGSCFADTMGERLSDSKFRVDVNPFGPLYHPIVVAHSLVRLLDRLPLMDEEWVSRDGMWYSWTHHSRYAGATRLACEQVINKRMEQAMNHLVGCNRLILTLGSSYRYELKEKPGYVVANCHKFPQQMFTRRRSSIAEMVEALSLALDRFFNKRTEAKVLFTVSPIRHTKDGAHANAVSKALLLATVDELVTRYGDRVAYFPSYEIVMDELRDYRFYAEDMVHLSAQAEQYIWDRFKCSFMTTETQQALKAYAKIRQAIAHRPFNTAGKAYRQFIIQTLLKIEQVEKKFTYFDLSQEKEILNKRLDKL